jgi:hypothetical protein
VLPVAFTPAAAGRIVDRIAGGRFELLIKYGGLRSPGDVDRKARELDEETSDRLLLCAAGLPSRHAFFRSVVAAGAQGLTSDAIAETGLSDAQLAALVRADIVAAHPGSGRYTFHSRHVARYFQKEAAAAHQSVALAVASQSPDAAGDDGSVLF